MPSTTAPIIAQVQQQVEGLLQLVGGPSNRELSAYEAELAIFRQLLRLGALLLELFFASRAAVRPAGPVRSADGTLLRYHDRRATSYYSIFGKLAVRRHAFTGPGQPVVCPLDAALSLPARCYSDLLREWAEYGASDGAYRASQALLGRVLGQAVSVQALETAAQEDAVDVGLFLTQPPAPDPAQPSGRLLVVQADGKGVPLVPAEAKRAATKRAARRGKGQPPGTKQEAIVTAVYTIEPAVRDPAAVLERLLPTDQAAVAAKPATWPRPVGKEQRASLDGKAAAVARLAARARQYAGPEVTQRLALTDGDAALQRAVQAALPGYVLVLDLMHVLEHLWEAATSLLGERHPQRTAWVRTRLEQVLRGQVVAVVTDLETLAQAASTSPTARKVLLSTAGYYQRNAPFMRYDQYLAAGWPIGTGVVEGACRHLVKDRLELAGMRWTKAGAQAILDLRAVRLNGQWDAYWRFHRHRAHLRRYGTPPPTSHPPELQAWSQAA